MTVNEGYKYVERRDTPQKRKKKKEKRKKRRMCQFGKVRKPTISKGKK